MDKKFWENPYQTRLETKVVSVEENRVLFEETIAFSFSGGQESDRAWINGVPVVESILEDDRIYYCLEDNHGLSPGDGVTMEIDWPRRYRLMRLHFAAELILELVTQKWGLEKIGAHIAETKSRIDFICSHNISSLFEEILKEYNAIITKDLPIQTGFSDLKEQKRFWCIEGFAQVPCGGTHVRSTGEVGFVTLKRVNLGGGKERIEIRLVESGTYSRRT